MRVEGILISTCVRRARNDGELQGLGLLYTAVAERLASRARTDERAATQLGYLAGAVRRGTGTDAGIAVELGRRIARTTSGIEGPALVAGLRAGERSG